MFISDMLKKQTLWPLFKDRVQLPLKPRATSRRQFTFYHYFLLILPFYQPQKTKGWKAELTLEPPSGFGHRTCAWIGESSNLTTIIDHHCSTRPLLQFPLLFLVEKGVASCIDLDNRDLLLPPQSEWSVFYWQTTVVL